MLFFGAAVEDQNVDSKKKLDVNNNQQTLKFQDDDKPLEQLLWKIEMMHSRVNKLKGQLDVVMSKNAAKFSSSENLSLLVPCDGQTPSPTFSPGNGEAISAGVMYNPVLHILEYDVSDLVMPESVISSYGGDFHVPDIIESTVGILSGSDVTFRQSQIGDSCEDVSVLDIVNTQQPRHHTHTHQELLFPTKYFLKACRYIYFKLHKILNEFNIIPSFTPLDSFSVIL